eukprot:6213553-Pleurochrysis_carterae.AAC.1
MQVRARLPPPSAPGADCPSVLPSPSSFTSFKPSVLRRFCPPRASAQTALAGAGASHPRLHDSADRAAPAPVAAGSAGVAAHVFDPAVLCVPARFGVGCCCGCSCLDADPARMLRSAQSARRFESDLRFWKCLSLRSCAATVFSSPLTGVCTDAAMSTSSS